ncbi:MAG: hypothetical protein WKF57_17945 [Nakamurella sp.]
MTNPVTAVDLAWYDTGERFRRVAARPSRRWRERTGAVLETWGRRLRATDVASRRRVVGMTTGSTAAVRVTPAGAR